MEQVIKQAAGTSGPAAQVIEVQEAVQPEGGVPWGGIGIGVLVVAVIAIATKVLSD